MEKMLILIFVILNVMGCKDSVKNNINVEKINFIGMTGKSENIQFISSKVGYSFNYVTESKNQTLEQLNDPNFFPESTVISTIFKTTDGGKTWVSVYSIKDYQFYNASFSDKNTIYIKIIDSKKVLKNKLLKFDLKTNKVTILNFNFERMGEIWVVNKKIFVNSKNNGVNNLYTIDDNFSKIDSIKENKVFKDKITLLGNTSFVVTWDNEIYNIDKKQSVIFDDFKIECITKKNESNLLIASKKKSSIFLVDYNTDNKEKKILKEFEGYSIVQGLQSNDKVICGFIGNIKGHFTEYDLFYSLDKGNTWQIQELKENSYIRPNILLDDILYIFSGGNRIQKLLFKNN